jgi:hypothetical protein
MRRPVTCLTVRSVSLMPPYENAALSLSVPWPGISTLRSRGSDSSAVASRAGSSRTRITVSERAPPPPSRAVSARLSEPTIMIVCGLPVSASASSLPS